MSTTGARWRVACRQGTRESAVARRLARQELVRDCLLVCMTLVTGACDALAFAHLGGVFTSVMTGNMVLLGIAVSRGDLTTFVLVGLALVAYVVGALLGACVAGDPRNHDPLWPRRVTYALLAETGVLLAFAVLWLTLTPTDATRNLNMLLVALCAVALGVQSSAVLRFGIAGLSTTYLTGTLTTVIAAAVARRPVRQVGRAILTLIALVVGAALGVLALRYALWLAPLLPLGLSSGVVLAGHWLELAGAEAERHRPSAIPGRQRGPDGAGVGLDLR
jgi:uncharacterized membrane protein YoaK (UPF0700 family)